MLPTSASSPSTPASSPPPVSLMEKISNFFSGIGIVASVKRSQKEYKDECDKMTAEEKAKEKDSKIEACKALCVGGLTSMYWKDTTTLLSKVDGINPSFASFLSLSFAVCQGAMLFGVAATSFPKASPWPVAVSSNGALCAVLCNIAAFHLEIVEFVHPTVLLIWWIVISVAFSAYWYASSQDMTIVKFTLKFLWLIITFVAFILWYLIIYPFYFIMSYAPSDFTASMGSRNSHQQ